MNWAEVINETLRYLEENIMTVQGPKEVAMSVHVSASYLQNSFQMITGYTIGEYIRSRRLYLAAMDLIEKDEKIIDVAQKYGYESQESFSRLSAVSTMQRLTRSKRRISPPRHFSL